MSDDFERRQSIAEAAYHAKEGVAVLNSRMDTHERICAERYSALAGWMKSTFFAVLAAAGALAFYLLVHHQTGA